VLTTADPSAPVQLVAIGPDGPITRSRAPAPGWLAAVADTGCAAPRSLPGLREFDNFAFGPCPGAAAELSEVTGQSWQFRRAGPLSVQLRGFFRLDKEDTFDLAITSDGAHRLFLDGRRVAGGKDPGGPVVTRRVRHRLGAGLHAIALSAASPRAELRLSVRLPAEIAVFTQAPEPRRRYHREP
jgi:hypothetical protein